MNAGSKRRKPPHAFVLLLFAVAVFYAFANVAAGYFLQAAFTEFNSHGALSAQVARGRLTSFEFARDAAESDLKLIAAAVLVALLDRIRWLLTPEPEREDLAGRYLVSRLDRMFDRWYGPRAD